MNRWPIALFFVIQFFFFHAGITQDLPGSLGVPEVIHYTRQEFNAYKQNWCVAQDAQGQIYVANSRGLLRFNGSEWQLYHLPYRQIVRSVAVDNHNKIYTGGFAEFGYWEKDSSNRLQYHSLSSGITDSVFRREEIWNILPANDNAVIFHSFSRIYQWKKNRITTTVTPSPISFVHYVAGRYLMGCKGIGMFEYKNNALTFIRGSEAMKEMNIAGILPYALDKMLVCTTRKGLFLYDGNTFTPFSSPANDFLKINEANRCLRINENTFVFGSILNGIIITDGKGQIRQHLHQRNALQNNTVLGLFTDKAGNLWAALDQGIDQVVLQSPFLHYKDIEGKLGTVYSAALFQGRFYLATNHGLFYCLPGDKDFTLVPELKGQVWNLVEYDHQLICGHNAATYRIDQNRVEKISDAPGGWSFKPLTKYPGYYVQGNYLGLDIYKRDESGKIVHFRHMAGTEGIAAKGLIEDKNGDIWVRHAYMGLYKITLAAVPDKVSRIVPMEAMQGLPVPGKLNLLSYHGTIRVVSPDKGLYYEASPGIFKPDTLLNRLLAPLGSIRRIMKADEQHWWVINNDNKLVLLTWQLNDSVVIQPLRHRNIFLVNDFENLYQFGDWTLFCTEDGFSLYNVSVAGNIRQPEVAPAIQQVQIITDTQRTVLSESTAASLSSKQNNLLFKFATPAYDEQPRYAVKMDGFEGHEQWSTWSTLPYKEFSNMPPGAYTFHVKSDQQEEEAVFHFTIQAPWYQRWWARTVYALLAVAAGIFLYYTYRRKLRLAHEKLHQQLEERLLREQQENERKLLLLQQQQLTAAVVSKSEALANSGVTLLEKNEFLLKMKKELLQLKAQSNPEFSVTRYNRLMKMIDKNLSAGDEQKVFDDGFNSAHERFFQQLHLRYPDLTPQDLKLAAYLKMNLSSKDIAHRFNITIRGVEVKRYRLRKKLGLPGDQNLTEFMLQI